MIIEKHRNDYTIKPTDLRHIYFPFQYGEMPPSPVYLVEGVVGNSVEYIKQLYHYKAEQAVKNEDLTPLLSRLPHFYSLSRMMIA